MKDIVDKIKKYIDKLEDKIQFSEDYIDGESIVYEMKCYIEELKKEQANKTFLDRLKEEREELKERFTKLTAFINNEELFSKVTKKQQYLLKEQSTAMSDYLYILNQRLFEYKREK